MESIRKSRRVSPPSRPLNSTGFRSHRTETAVRGGAAVAMPCSRLTSARSRSWGEQRGACVSGGTLTSTETPRPSSAPCAERTTWRSRTSKLPAAGAAAGAVEATGVGVEPSAAGRPRLWTSVRRRNASLWMARMAAARFSRASSR